MKFNNIAFLTLSNDIAAVVPLRMRGTYSGLTAGIGKVILAGTSYGNNDTFAYVSINKHVQMSLMINRHIKIFEQ